MSARRSIHGASAIESAAEFAEARLPMAAAVVASMVLTLLLPADLRLGPQWLLPAIEGLLLVALIIGDPGRITRRSVVLRDLSISLVAVLGAGAVWSTFQLTDQIIHGGSDTETAPKLLQAGSAVWISGILAFTLLYFELDAGGPAARAHEMPEVPDLAFPQQLNPELGGTSWRPRFIDYLYLGVTNALAFSPTDVMPLVPWGKITMAVQSLISLAILGLVIAQAINVLPSS
jgi:hypothetical protein